MKKGQGADMLYKGGLKRKRKYTSIRNSGDVFKQYVDESERNEKLEFLQGCEVPEIFP